MFDLGLPMVDVCLWLADLPKVERVSAAYAAGDEPVDHSGSAYLHCEGGLTIFVDVSWKHIGPKEKVWFEVMGSQGSAKIGALGIYKEMHGQPIEVGARNLLHLREVASAPQGHQDALDLLLERLGRLEHSHCR